MPAERDPEQNQRQLMGKKDEAVEQFYFSEMKTEDDIDQIDNFMRGITPPNHQAPASDVFSNDAFNNEELSFADDSEDEADPDDALPPKSDYQSIVEDDESGEDLDFDFEDDEPGEAVAGQDPDQPMTPSEVLLEWVGGDQSPALSRPDSTELSEVSIRAGEIAEYAGDNLDETAPHSTRLSEPRHWEGDSDDIMMQTTAEPEEPDLWNMVDEDTLDTEDILPFSPPGEESALAAISPGLAAEPESENEQEPEPVETKPLPEAHASGIVESPPEAAIKVVEEEAEGDGIAEAAAEEIAQEEEIVEEAKEVEEQGEAGQEEVVEDQETVEEQDVAREEDTGEITAEPCEENLPEEKIEPVDLSKSLEDAQPEAESPEEESPAAEAPPEMEEPEEDAEINSSAEVPEADESGDSFVDVDSLLSGITAKGDKAIEAVDSDDNSDDDLNGAESALPESISSVNLKAIGGDEFNEEDDEGEDKKPKKILFIPRNSPVFLLIMIPLRIIWLICNQLDKTLKWRDNWRFLLTIVSVIIIVICLAIWIGSFLNTGVEI